MASKSYIYEDPTDYTQAPYTDVQLTGAAQRAGIDPASLVDSYRQNSSPTPPATPTPGGSKAPAGTQNPTWMYAVNMPSTYPDYAAMKAAGTGLVVDMDDPNAQILIDGAKAWGVAVAIQVTARSGETPAAYVARVQAAQAQGVNQLVLDIESPGKGYEGSPGWQFSQAVGDALKGTVTVPVAVTMGPHQDDYNYQAFQGVGAGTTNFWVQGYTGDMTSVDSTWATSSALGAGVQVTLVGAPGQPPPAGGGQYVSFGIPQNGASSAGVYGGYPPSPDAAPGSVQPPRTQGSPPVNAGNNDTGYDPWFHPTGQGSPPGSGGGTSPGSGPSTGSTAGDWAKAYFGDLGLPQDVQDQVSSLFAKYPDNPDLAVALAKQYIRTTPWFNTNYPGFFQGLRAGLFQDETGYRGYVSQANLYTMQYFGRPITSNEVESAMHFGYTPEYLGRTYEASALAKANGGEWQYELGAFGDIPFDQQAGDQQQAVTDLSRQQAGIGTFQGSRIQAALDRANKRMQTLFGGQLAVPNTAGQALAPRNPDLPA